jgi:hypothetical protein
VSTACAPPAWTPAGLPPRWTASPVWRPTGSWLSSYRKWHEIPVGYPRWIYNHRTTITMMEILVFNRHMKRLPFTFYKSQSQNLTTITTCSFIHSMRPGDQRF